MLFMISKMNMRWPDGAQPGESAGRDDKLITINNYHVARDENGMGKFRSDRHRFPYKPIVYHFDRKNRNRKENKKNRQEQERKQGSSFPDRFHGNRISYRNSHQDFPVSRSSPECPPTSPWLPRAPSRPKAQAQPTPTKLPTKP